MSLLPRSPEIITSAPQLPEKKYPFSPGPQNPWGPVSVLLSACLKEIQGVKCWLRLPYFLMALPLTGGKSPRISCLRKLVFALFSLLQ